MIPLNTIDDAHRSEDLDRIGTNNVPEGDGLK